MEELYTAVLRHKETLARKNPKNVDWEVEYYKLHNTTGAMMDTYYSTQTGQVGFSQFHKDLKHLDHIEQSLSDREDSFTENSRLAKENVKLHETNMELLDLVRRLQSEHGDLKKEVEYLMVEIHRLEVERTDLLSLLARVNIVVYHLEKIEEEEYGMLETVVDLKRRVSELSTEAFASKKHVQELQKTKEESEECVTMFQSLKDDNRALADTLDYVRDQLLDVEHERDAAIEKFKVKQECSVTKPEAFVTESKETGSISDEMLGITTNLDTVCQSVQRVNQILKTQSMTEPRPLSTVTPKLRTFFKTLNPNLSRSTIPRSLTANQSSAPVSFSSPAAYPNAGISILPYETRIQDQIPMPPAPSIRRERKESLGAGSPLRRVDSPIVAADLAAAASSSGLKLSENEDEKLERPVTPGASFQIGDVVLEKGGSCGTR